MALRSDSTTTPSIHSRRWPALQRQPGGWSWSGQAAAKPSRTKSLPTKPLSSAGSAAIRRAAKPSDALEWEHYPHDEARNCTTSPLAVSGTPRPHPRRWWNTGWAGAAGRR